MSADDSRVNHQVFEIAVSGAKCKELFKDLLLRPARKAFVNRVPIAICSGQGPPLSIRASHPQNGIEETTAFVFLADVDIGTGSQKRQNLLPLLICQSYGSHSKSLQQMSTEPSLLWLVIGYSARGFNSFPQLHLMPFPSLCFPLPILQQVALASICLLFYRSS